VTGKQEYVGYEYGTQPVAVTLPTIEPAYSPPVGDAVWLMPPGFQLWDVLQLGKGLAVGSADGSQLIKTSHRRGDREGVVRDETEERFP
jgi:hypothetical protein